jgi:predicted RNase H-like nuclease/ppGpp synthetase/RelA/SpoT-type nucleotidyltranferase
MHYIGIDLAWGEVRPTGLAVLDDGGRLVHLSAHDTDESIVAALADFRETPVLVAIDAPLVVVNATGNRPCEAALNRDFARFDAGAHPANTGKPEFAETPRGARLAKALGLDINPASRRPRRAIEVYPHPATITLFRLGRVLKYKQRPGRTVPQLRAAMLELIGHVEGLADAETPMVVTRHEGWRQLVAQVRGAARKSELRRAEDQIDAVVCAYIARFVVAHPERTTTYGDLATGYIVTPTLPEGQEPAPRASRAAAESAAAEPAAAEAAEPAAEPAAAKAAEPAEPAAVEPAVADPVREAVQAYLAQYPSLERATEKYVALITSLLDEAGINYLTVTGRAKSVGSFAGKAARTADGRPVYTDPLRQITDQVGVRVITYLVSDVQAVVDLLADQLTVLLHRDMGLETAQEGRFGYSSQHVLVQLDDARSHDPEYASLAGRPASVQVRTVLQHAWAEFEHDIRYKGTVPEEYAPDLDRRFTLAAGLLDLADREFSAIRDRLQESMTGHQLRGDAGDPRISAQDLAAFLAGRFPGAGWSRTDHYAWVSGLLLELGIASLQELGEVLGGVDSAAISRRMGYRYPPGAVRRLDDALLEVFGDRYVTLHGNARRAEALRARLEKLRG